MKKILIASLAALAISACGLALSACSQGDGGNGGTPSHEHHMTRTQAVEPTCKEGNVEYYTCDGCGLTFLDENGKTQVTDLDELILEPVSEHEYSVQWSAGNGKHWHECKNCGAKKDEQSHDLEFVPAKDAKCTENGNTAYNVCRVCETLYSDPVGNTQITDPQSVIIKSEGHKYSEQWSTDSLQHWHESSVCRDKKDLANHNFVDDVCEDCKTERVTEYLRYNLTQDGKGYKVSKGEATDTDIIIPAEYNGLPVVELGVQAFYNSDKITSVKIPESVTIIGANAFSGCSSLASVNLPAKLTAIDYYAFSECSALTDIVIPEQVTKIADYAFRGCVSLKTVTIRDGITEIGDYAFERCPIETATIPAIAAAYISYGGGSHNPNTTLKTVVITSGNTVGDLAYCSALTSVTMPSTTTTIYNNAFIGCTSLEEIAIPQTVTSINDYAFAGCSKLKAVNFPAGLTAIGMNAFGGCASIKSVKIPEGITEIDYRMFSDCTSLASVEFHENLTDIGNEAFKNCSALKSVTFPADLKTIGAEAFYGCVSLTEIEVPAGVTDIGRNAFYNCSALVSVSVPFAGNNAEGTEAAYFYYAFGVTGDYGNQMNKNIKSITITGNITKIGNSAFTGMNITEISLPDSVTEIGESAFSGCAYLENVTLPEQLITLGQYAFYRCYKLESVTLGDKLETIGYDAFRDDEALSRVYISDLAAWLKINFRYVDGNGLTAQPLAYGGTLYLDGSPLTRISTPAGITEIKPAAFAGCTSITSVTLSDEVISIGDRAFNSCYYLAEINLGNSLETIGSYAFSYCRKLVNITLPATLTQIKDFAFAYCYKIIEVRNLSSLDIATRNDHENGKVWVSDSVERVITEDADSNLQNINGLVFYTDDAKVRLMAYVGNSSELILPEKYVYGSVTRDYSINNHAFAYNDTLKSITIPSTITQIPYGAFYGCANLETVNLHDGINVIENNAFFQCRSLKNVTIPAGINKISQEAFRGCSSLEGIIIPENITEIGEFAFSECTSLKSITLPESLKTISQSVFSGCTALKTVNLPENMAYIPQAMFSGCTELIAITLPQSITGIGDRAFYGCSALEELVIPDSVQNIKYGAFSLCTNLRKVTLGSGVTEIGNNAFTRCYKLLEIYNRSSLVITQGANHDDNGSIGVYAVNVYSSDEGGNKGSYSATANGFVLYTFKDKVYIAGYTGKETVLTLPADFGGKAYSIAPMAFNGCAFTMLTIPEGFTAAGDYAFCGAEIESIVLPESLASVGCEAFTHTPCTVYYCGSMEDWQKLQDSDPDWNNKYNYSFGGGNVYYYSETKPDNNYGYYWHYDEDGNIVFWTL